MIQNFWFLLGFGFIKFFSFNSFFVFFNFSLYVGLKDLSLWLWLFRYHNVWNGLSDFRVLHCASTVQSTVDQSDSNPRGMNETLWSYRVFNAEHDGILSFSMRLAWTKLSAILSDKQGNFKIFLTENRLVNFCRVWFIRKPLKCSTFSNFLRVKSQKDHIFRLSWKCDKFIIFTPNVTTRWKHGSDIIFWRKIIFFDVYLEIKEVFCTNNLKISKINVEKDYFPAKNDVTPLPPSSGHTQRKNDKFVAFSR